MSSEPLRGWGQGTIGDVAVMKCHQQLDKISIFFFFYLHIRKISKVVYKKTLPDVCCIKTHHACIHKERMLIAQDCIKFRGHIAWQSFLVNNFADFPDLVRSKSQDFVPSLVVFPYSNICYYRVGNNLTEMEMFNNCYSVLNLLSISNQKPNKAENF